MRVGINVCMDGLHASHNVGSLVPSTATCAPDGHFSRAHALGRVASAQALMAEPMHAGCESDNTRASDAFTLFSGWGDALIRVWHIGTGGDKQHLETDISCVDSDLSRDESDEDQVTNRSSSPPATGSSRMSARSTKHISDVESDGSWPARSVKKRRKTKRVIQSADMPKGSTIATSVVPAIQQQQQREGLRGVLQARRASRLEEVLKQFVAFRSVSSFGDAGSFAYASGVGDGIQATGRCNYREECWRCAKWLAGLLETETGATVRLEGYRGDDASAMNKASLEVDGIVSGHTAGNSRDGTNVGTPLGVDDDSLHNPVVVGRVGDTTDPNKPTVIIYGHYDVVAPGDRSAWRSDPWTLTSVNGYLYGRGATDDKVCRIYNICLVYARVLKPGSMILLLNAAADNGAAPPLNHLASRHPSRTC